MPRGVRAVLFDLDDTLFDHSHATSQALERLRRDEPRLAAFSGDELAERHRRLLELLHLDVLAGRRTIDEARTERFRLLLDDVDAGHAARVAHQYRDAYQASWRAVPGAVALVAAVRASGCRVVIVTNNIRSEQVEKLSRCGLTSLVDSMVTSEEVGSMKPDRVIFDEALRRCAVGPADAVMVGDVWETDIAGARQAGISAVWFNRRGQASPPGPAVPSLQSLEPLETALDAILG